MIHPAVSIIVPPYVTTIPFRGAPPALGSVFITHVAGGADAIRFAVEAQRTAPWCPLCLVLDERPLTAELVFWIQRLSRWTVVHPSIPAGDPVAIDGVLHLVTARPLPKSGALARYVALRAGRPEMRQPLRDCFRGVRPSGTRRAWLSRHLKTFGPLTAHDWHAVAQLLPLRRTGQVSFDRKAYECRLDPRTVRSRLLRYTGISAQEFQELVGWEWLIEAVLRLWGYVPAEAVLIAGEHNGTDGS